MLKSLSLLIVGILLGMSVIAAVPTSAQSGDDLSVADELPKVEAQYRIDDLLFMFECSTEPLDTNNPYWLQVYWETDDGMIVFNCVIESSTQVQPVRSPSEKRSA
jgi:hypothetical protein